MCSDDLAAQPNTLSTLKALNHFAAAEDPDALWQALVDYAGALDADLLSYHHHAAEMSPGHENVTVRAHGFSKAWVHKYTKSKLYLTDPITQVFATRMRAMRWSEVDDIVKLTPGQKDYLADLRSWMKGDGIGLPVFGPSGRIGYVGIGRSERRLDDFGPIEINRLQWVAQSFHIRWCELALMHAPKDFTLDDKEMRILECLAIGMQDEVICGVVGAQLDSVKLSIRRILKKMSVTDRPSAILRGIGAGLLEPQTALLKTV